MDFILTSAFWLFIVALVFVGVNLLAYAFEKRSELKPFGRFLFTASGGLLVVGGLYLAYRGSTDERKPADKTVRIIIENRTDDAETEVDR